MGRAAGGDQVRLIIGDATGRAVEKSDPEATGGRVLYMPAPPVEPAVDRRALIRARLFGMAGALEAMRTWTGPSETQLAALIGESRELATGARAMTISGAPADLALVAAIDAVAAAANARARALADGTPQSRANAMSAAAGALMLLEHARAIDTGNVNVDGR